MPWNTTQTVASSSHLVGTREPSRRVVLVCICSLTVAPHLCLPTGPSVWFRADNEPVELTAEVSLTPSLLPKLSSCLDPRSVSAWFNDVALHIHLVFWSTEVYQVSLVLYHSSTIFPVTWHTKASHWLSDVLFWALLSDGFLNEGTDKKALVLLFSFLIYSHRFIVRCNQLLNAWMSESYASNSKYLCWLTAAPTYSYTSLVSVSPLVTVHLHPSHL